MPNFSFSFFFFIFYTPFLSVSFFTPLSDAFEMTLASSSSSSLKPFQQIDSRSLSTSLLPRPSQLALPQPSSSTLMSQVQRRRPSHIPQLKPSFSNNSSGSKTVLTTTTSSQSSRSTSTSLLALPHSSAIPGTHSSPLKMVGQQQVNARVLVHCLGTQLLVDDSGAVVNIQRQHQQQQQQQQQHSVNSKGKRFVFDHALHEKKSIQDIMPALYSLLRQSLYGYHGTILNYGPSGCGKSSVRQVLGSRNETGVIFRSLETLFDMMYKEIGTEFILRASYYEIYQDTLYDLLCPSNSNIDVHQTKKRSTFIAPLTEEIITSPTDVLRIIHKGQANLYLCPDKHSYQESHVIFQLVIESYKCSDHPKKSNMPGASLSSTSTSSNSSNAAKRVTISHLMFVDLAEGSTPPPTSSTADLQNHSLRRRHNRKDTGLAAFESRVIQLTGKDQRYTPVDIKKNVLTQLLESSLTGRTNLLSICTINDKNHPYEYLKFSHRLRKLLVSPITNEENETHSVLLRHRRDRIKLKHKLKQLSMECGQHADHSQLIRAALTRQLTYNEEQVIVNEKYNSGEPSPSTSSSSSSLSSLLAVASIAKAMTDKMEGFQAYDWSLINELSNEKNRLEEQHQALSHQLALIEQQLTTVEQQKSVLDNINFLQDELKVAKTELQVTKLLVRKA
ncbi:kinesin motor domain-domain-containing protein [Absidia repens]|uniref:Kinesin motor domain-domain-containing protein n=1 Tax=Absidia repens TaxID=90262 RepID=A0A1X2ICI6_9FUNG|nr:kinesin motor domain-domain-containing protein [Absidia repens]